LLSYQFFDILTGIFTQKVSVENTLESLLGDEKWLNDTRSLFDDELQKKIAHRQHFSSISS
jgi:hypothetical protein